MIECLTLVHTRSEIIHQDFLEKYAILEDKKRRIMAAITEKQEELVVSSLASELISLFSKHINVHFQPLAVKRHQAIISLGHEVENGQLEGMAFMKGTCQRMLISVLLFSCLSAADLHSFVPQASETWPRSLALCTLIAK
jgi:hypothetical protein